MNTKKGKRYAVVEEKFCVACGSCSKVCPRKAITVPKGVCAIVDLEKCVGCSLCVKACPASVISIEKKEASDEE